MKTAKIIQDFSLIDEIEEATSDFDKEFVSRSLEIASQIAYILDSKSLMQKDLAKILHKSESEISKWLSGFHNFTLRTIVKMEVLLKKRIITTEQEVVRELFKAIEKFSFSKENMNISAPNIKQETTTSQTGIIIPLVPGKLPTDAKPNFKELNIQTSNTVYKFYQA